MGIQKGCPTNFRQEWDSLYGRPTWMWSCLQMSKCCHLRNRYAILWDLVLKIFEQRYGHAYPRKISSQFFRNNATKNRSLVPPTSLHRSMSTMSTCPVEIEHANTGVHIWLCSEGFACTYKKIELRWFLGFLGVLYSNHGWWGRDEPPKGLVRWGHDDGAMRGGPGNCYQYIHNTKSSDEPPMSTSPE